MSSCLLWACPPAVPRIPVQPFNVQRSAGSGRFRRRPRSAEYSRESAWDKKPFRPCVRRRLEHSRWLGVGPVHAHLSHAPFPTAPARPSLYSRGAVKCCRAREPEKPGTGSFEPPFIPQTIEYALREAQAATAQALIQDVTRLVVTLPMGRSRRHWYRLSPLDGELVRGESAVLTLHFAELFKGARMRVVLGADARPEWSIPWMQKLQLLDEAAYGEERSADVVEGSSIDSSGDEDWEEEPPPTAEPDDVLIVGAVSSKQKKQLDMLLAKVAPETAIVLFNCLIELPAAPLPFPPDFRPAYVCRSENKTAVLFVGYGPDADGWHIYTETAIFEYEWVGCRREPDWQPTAKAVEMAIQARGARRKSINGYWESVASGCESGFWPFCTIACRDVLPLPGSKFEKKTKAPRSNSKPFGFF